MAPIHPDICDRLLSYLDGRLDEHLRRQVQIHLESCGPCSEELAAIRATAGALRQVGQGESGFIADDERYGCPGTEEMTVYAAQEASHQTVGSERITRHLAACLRCQHEVDLIRLMTRQLAQSSGPIVPQGLSTRIEARLMAQIQQERGADHQTVAPGWFSSWSRSFVWRAALGVGCAATVAVWGIIRLQSSPVLVIQRSSVPDTRAVQPMPVPSAGPKQRPQGVPERPSLPPLVPAKQREAPKWLILPMITHPELRSAVAAALADQLKAIQPPEREFPSEPSVDDIAANRDLGRLFGVRYVLEINVKKRPSGYRVVLRAADTETGGLVAMRAEQASEEGVLPAVATRLARELQQELLAK